MASPLTNQDHHWAVILAGGEGTRLTPLVERWLGQALPKQYCTFVGTRSMFQHTLDRARQLTFPDHTVSVIARSHSSYALQQFENRASGTVLVQPMNREVGE